MVMGIVRRGCLKSIAWHESSRRIDALQAQLSADSRAVSLPASRCMPTGNSIGEAQDEPVREWPDHPSEKQAATVSGLTAWRFPGLCPTLWQQRSRDPKLPTAMRTAHRFKASHPVQECRH